MSLQTDADDRLPGFSDSDLLLLYNLLSGKAQIGCWTGGKTQRVWETASFSQSLNQSALNSAENLPVLHVYEYVQVLHFLFQLAQIKRCKKSSNLCVKSAEMYLVQRESLTSLLSAPRRSASLCLLRKWVFHPADASCLGTLSGAHPAAASRGSGSAHRSRKKRSLKKFWYLIKSVSTLKNNWNFGRTQINNSSGVFQRNQLTRGKDCRWKMYVIMWHHPMVSGLHTCLCARSCACLWSKCCSNTKFASTQKKPGGVHAPPLLPRVHLNQKNENCQLYYQNTAVVQDVTYLLQCF